MYKPDPGNKLDQNGLPMYAFPFVQGNLRNNPLHLPIETIMEIDNGNYIMAAHAVLRVRKDQRTKKSSAQHKTPEGKTKNFLSIISEHSLSKFLDDEPDIYSVSDLKVRYR